MKKSINVGLCLLACGLFAAACSVSNLSSKPIPGASAPVEGTLPKSEGISYRDQSILESRAVVQPVAESVACAFLGADSAATKNTKISTVKWAVDNLGYNNSEKSSLSDPAFVVEIQGKLHPTVHGSHDTAAYSHGIVVIRSRDGVILSSMWE